MSKTPRTDAVWHATLDWCNKRDQSHDPQHAALANLSEALERDLSDALAMLRSVQGYLEAGMCGCLYDGAYLSTCRRCDLLDDVKTTLANCGRKSAKFNKILNFEENAKKAK